MCVLWCLPQQCSEKDQSMKNIRILLSLVGLLMATNTIFGADVEHEENIKTVKKLYSRFRQCLVVTNSIPKNQVRMVDTQEKPKPLSITFKVLSSNEDYGNFLNGNYNAIQDHTCSLEYHFSMEGQNAAHTIFTGNIMNALNKNIHHDDSSQMYMPYSFTGDLRIWCLGPQDFSLTCAFFNENEPIDPYYQFPQVLFLKNDTKKEDGAPKEFSLQKDPTSA